MKVQPVRLLKAPSTEYLEELSLIVLSTMNKPEGDCVLIEYNKFDEHIRDQLLAYMEIVEGFKTDYPSNSWGKKPEYAVNWCGYRDQESLYYTTE